MERKAKHAAVMMKRIPKISAVVVAASGDTDDRIVTGRPSPHKEAAASTNQSKTLIDSVGGVKEEERLDCVSIESCQGWWHYEWRFMVKGGVFIVV